MRPAVEDLVRAGLARSRGTADRAVRTAGPLVSRLAGAIESRLRRRPVGRPATFTPAPLVAVPDPAPTAGSAGSAPAAASPSPATVARNIGPRRPTAAPSRRRPVRPSMPGAKLPPPRAT